MKTTLSEIEQSNSEVHDLQNSREDRLLRNFEDSSTILSEIKQSNENLLANIQTNEQDLIVIQNHNEVCARYSKVCANFSELIPNRIFKQFDNREICNDGVNKTPIIRGRPVDESQSIKFKSCVELQKNGFTASGVYDIYPNNRDTTLRVYCDQDTDGGGWIVFQRREDGSENFYRNWHDYKVGFGNIEGEFWLGNENLHLLTATCCHKLRIDMEDFENERRYAKYSNFRIGTESTNYVLTVEGYTEDAGDSLEYHNKQAFTTYDRDNDQEKVNCAVDRKGAWWYNGCHQSNLNGLYLEGHHSKYVVVAWYHWRSHYYSLKMTEMKLR